MNNRVFGLLWKPCERFFKQKSSHEIIKPKFVQEKNEVGLLEYFYAKSLGPERNWWSLLALDALNSSTSI
jgi:hypothetical protein